MHIKKEQWVLDIETDARREAGLKARHIRDGEAIERLLAMMIEEDIKAINADHLGRLYIHLSDGKDAFGGEK